MNNYLNDNHIRLNSENYCLYYLNSVIIHDGTNEERQYFILLKDNSSSNWYKINDEFIDKFDIQNLDKEAFWEKMNLIKLKKEGIFTILQERK